MGDETLKVILDAEVSGFRGGFRTARFELDETRKAMGKLPGQTRSVNNAFLQFGRAAQDAAYGPAAVLNQVDLVAESFAAARREAAATGITFKRALVGAMLGPAGLFAAFSVVAAVAIAFGDDIKKAFGTAMTSAKEFKSAISDLLEVDFGIDKFVVKIEQIGAVLDRFKDLRPEFESRASEAIGGTRNVENFFAGGLKGRITRGLATVGAFLGDKEAASALRAANAFRAVEGELQGIADKGAVLKELADVFKELGLSKEGGDKAGAEALEKAWRTRRLAISRGADDFEAAAVRIREAYGEILNVLTRQPKGTFIGDTDIIDTTPLKRVQDSVTGDLKLAPPVLREVRGEMIAVGEEMTDMQAAAKEIGLAFDAALGEGMRSTVDGLSDAIGAAVSEFVLGAQQMSRAQRDLRRLDLEDARRSVEEAYREGEITRERFRAEMAVLKEEMDAFSLETSKALTDRFRRAFASIVDIVRSAMRQVIADITAALVKAAILQGIGLLLGSSTGGASTFIRSALSLPVPKVKALQVAVTGQTVTRGTDQVTTIINAARQMVRGGNTDPSVQMIARGF